MYATIPMSAAPNNVQIDFEFFDGGTCERTLLNSRKHNHVWNMFCLGFIDINEWKFVQDCSGEVGELLLKRKPTTWISFELKIKI